MDRNHQHTNPQLPRELQAVLHIFNYDDELRRKALPHVNIKRQSINWSEIWRNDLAGGHSAAVLWAQAIWCDKVETKSDPFDRAFAMDPELQRVVCEAMAIRWNIKTGPS